MQVNSQDTSSSLVACEGGIFLRRSTSVRDLVHSGDVFFFGVSHHQRITSSKNREKDFKTSKAADATPIREMQNMKMAAVAILSATASVEAFAPGAGPQMQRRSLLSRAAERRPALRSMKMQEQGSAVLDKPVAAAAPDSSGADAYHARHWKDFQSSSAAVTPAASVAPVAKKEAPTPTPKATAPAPKATAPDAKKESAAPAKSTEPNAFAMMALKAGFLKQSSPLIMSPMAGNKGFDPAGFAKVCVCLFVFPVSGCRYMPNVQ
jgi:hypothetical protein